MLRNTIYVQHFLFVEPFPGIRSETALDPIQISPSSPLMDSETSMDDVSSSFSSPKPHHVMFFNSSPSLPSTPTEEIKGNGQINFECKSPRASQVETDRNTGRKLVVSEESTDEEETLPCDPIFKRSIRGKNILLFIETTYVKRFLYFKTMISFSDLNDVSTVSEMNIISRKCFRFKEFSSNGSSGSKCKSSFVSVDPPYENKGSLKRQSSREYLEKPSQSNVSRDITAFSLSKSDQNCDEIILGASCQEVQIEQENKDDGFEMGNLESLFSSESDSSSTSETHSSLMVDPLHQGKNMLILDMRLGQSNLFKLLTIDDMAGRNEENFISNKEELRLINLKLNSYKLRIRECRIMNRRRICNLQRQHLDLKNRKYKLILENLEENERKYIHPTKLFDVNEKDE